MNEIFEVIQRCREVSDRGSRAASVSEDSRCAAIIHNVINGGRVTAATRSRAASVSSDTNKAKVIHDFLTNQR